MSDLARLQRVIDYQFSNTELLSLALAHRSVGSRNNERLEFLGDSIVNHVIAQALYHQFPAAREGELSRMRAALVKGETLAELAIDLGLGEFLILGPGEKKSGGHRRRSILADSFEAVAGAILMDSDVETVEALLLRWFAPRLAQLDVVTAHKDAKTRLQEFLQGRKKPLPEYQVLKVSGEDHNQLFEVVCRIKKPELSVPGSGSTRRKAEQSAAQAALEKLNVASE